MKPSSPRKGISAIWAVILTIFAASIGIPILIAVAAVVLALLIAAYSVILAFFVTSVAFVAAGIFCAFISIPFAFADFLTAMVSMGCGLVLTGTGILLFYITYKLNAVIIHAMLAGAKKITRRNRK